MAYPNLGPHGSTIKTIFYWKNHHSNKKDWDMSFHYAKDKILEGLLNVFVDETIHAGHIGLKDHKQNH